jgi:hypothetical protein
MDLVVLAGMWPLVSVLAAALACSVLRGGGAGHDLPGAVVEGPHVAPAVPVPSPREAEAPAPALQTS